jgi:phosphate transport system protein
MRDKFEEELLDLNNNLICMGALCEKAISQSVDSFLKGEQNYFKQAMKLENKIDSMEKTIEQQCLKLILQQQPVAKDLRIISAALKMITDLERIGDQAVDIAELTQVTKDTFTSRHIQKMAQEVVFMVMKAIDSFVKNDIEMAKEVIEHDDVVDELFSKAKEDIINDIKKDGFDPEVMLDLLMISKYLERIADHATNIAEWVVFSITGKHEEE